MLSSIRWRIIIPYTFIILSTTLGLTLYISGAVRKARLDDLEDHLLSSAWLAAPEVTRHLGVDTPADVAALDYLARHWASVTGDRITIISDDGTVLGESHADPAQMDNHLLRPEIQEALLHSYGTSRRYSRTLRRDVMYAAVALYEEGVVTGFVRIALPLEEIQENVNQLSGAIVVAGVITALLSILMASLIAERTIRPIRRLTSTVENVAAGDLSARLLPTTRDEVGLLTRAFNHMADQLRDQVATLAVQRGRLTAVLDNMADGVIITDETGLVTLINAAAARMLRFDEERALGRTFAQLAYSHQLVNLWETCAETGEEQAEMVESLLYGNFLHVVITPLQEAEPPRYLVILQDLTQVRRLETIRRDFISNISHELRTPLASLSLVVETLKDGAIEDPPAARRFLTHMESELASLTQMVEELLELSRIESGRVPLTFQPTRIRKLLRKPVRRLRPQADRRGVQVILSLAEDLPLVRADAKRIHQVVTNLLHNAIKFTPPEGVITIFAKRYEELKSVEKLPPDTLVPGKAPGDVPPPATAADEVVIGVADTGIGISEEDLPRIFERFYKTDRARAQEGTGLGLAIAKHIVQGHNGRIWVESIEGVGSTFYFTLPVADGAG